jgi:hypothetical protein
VVIALPDDVANPANVTGSSKAEANVGAVDMAGFGAVGQALSGHDDWIGQST